MSTSTALRAEYEYEKPGKSMKLVSKNVGIHEPPHKKRLSLPCTIFEVWLTPIAEG